MRVIVTGTAEAFNRLLDTLVDSESSSVPAPGSRMERSAIPSIGPAASGRDALEGGKCCSLLNRLVLQRASDRCSCWKTRLPCLVVLFRLVDNLSLGTSPILISGISWNQVEEKIKRDRRSKKRVRLGHGDDSRTVLTTRRSINWPTRSDHISHTTVNTLAPE